GSLVLLTSIFGGKIAIAYVVVGLILAVIGGTLIEKFGMEKYVEDFIKHGEAVELESQRLNQRERLVYSRQQVGATVKKVVVYILVGVAIGALIHNWIPAETIQQILGEENPFSVVIATLVGIPMYADIFGAIPIAEALFAKGVGIGTVLSFMMGVTALSLPSMIMIKKAIKPKLLVVFVATVTVGIILIGYLFNAVQYLLV
ncbi:MAG: permease, partial [Anaerovoracaceae bacterium]